MTAEATPIPVIRLDDPDKNKDAQILRETCISTGFFYLEGHGVPQETIDQVFAQSKAFFDLPLSTKQQLAHSSNRGYTTFEFQKLDPEKQKDRGDTKESYQIREDIPEDDDRFDPKKMRGPNPWPKTDMMKDADTFRETMANHYKTSADVAFRLTRMFALALGLEETELDSHFDEPLASLRLLHYSSEASNPDSGLFACGEHTDWGMITLLLLDDNPGLQILTQDGEWIDVPPRRGACVVNLGDALMRWSNDLFRSTPHRVLTSGKKDRYSIPFFYDPNFDAKLECIRTCCSPDNPPKYPVITEGEHLMEKYRQTAFRSSIEKD